MAYEMNLEEVLRHMASYLDIYKYLSNAEDAKADTVKEYLMKELGKPESTARSNINSVVAGEKGLVCEFDGDLYLSQTRIENFEKALEEILKWDKFDERSELIKELEEGANLAWDSCEEAESLAKKTKKEMEAQRRRYDERIWKLEMQIMDLQEKLIDRRFEQRTLILSSVQIGPDEVGLYKDEQFPFGLRHPTIDEKTMDMESYLSEIPDDDLVDELKPDKDVPGKYLRKINIKEWQFAKVFPKFFRDKVLEHIGPYVEHRKAKYPMVNMISVGKLLAMTDISNAEKMALYTTCCDEMSEEKAELLKDAARDGLDADFVIRVLESRKVSAETKERLWNAIQIIKNNSEYYMRHKFAMELIEKKWYIKADYCGREEKFQLIPMCEINALKHKVEKMEKEYQKYVESHDDLVEENEEDK